MPEPREIGRMEDVDGVPVIFSLNLDGTLRVRIMGTRMDSAMADLDDAKTEEFGRLFIAGAWSAGAQSAHLDAQEAHEADGGDTQARVGFPLHARYAYPDAGYTADSQAAAAVLTLGEVYGIHALEVGQSCSYFRFDGVPGQFNTVLFEPVTDDG